LPRRRVHRVFALLFSGTLCAADCFIFAALAHLFGGNGGMAASLR
jgi:hypothetical protein